MTPLVVAASDITGRLAEKVAEASQRARVRIQVWKGDPLTEEPAVVLDELPVGERRIPEPVLRLAGEAWPDARILLLAHDPLVRPIVNLQDGRVTLLGPPHDSESIAGTLRALVSRRRKRAPTMSLTGQGDASGPVVVREQLRANHWVARIGALAPEHAAGRVPLPVLAEHALDGLAVVFPLPYGSDHDEGDIARILSALRVEGDAAARDQAVAQAIGASAAVVHLNPTKDAWTFYWPDAEAPLWLYSPMRLPAWWDLGQALVTRGRTLAVVPAHAGDLIVGLSSWGPLTLADGTGRESLASALAGGSPSMVELLERRLLTEPRLFAAALVELR